MQTGSSKLPPSMAATAVFLLGMMDVALIGLIASEEFGSPLVAGICAAIAFISLGGFVFAMYRLLRQSPPREGLHSVGRLAWLVASSLFWAVAAGLAILGIGYGAALALPAVVPVLLYCFAFGALILGTWAGAQRTIRRRRMLLILGNIEKAVRLQLPLPRMILAAAEGEKGLMRRRLLALADELDRGEGIDQALINAVPEMPISLARMIAAGQRLGCLPHVLEEIVRRRYEDEPGYRPSAGFYWVYPLVLIVVISFMMIAVIPKYEGIFRDFRLELPASTRALLRIANNAAGFAALIVLIALIPLGRVIASFFPAFRAVSPFDGIFLDQILWWTPLMGGYVRDRGLAELCDILSAGVRAGHPITESLHEAAAVQESFVLRYRAGAWADAVARGQNLADGARYARMPRLMTAMLATVRGSDSLLEVLAFLRRHYQYRFSRARAVMQAALVPLIVLMLGLAVGFVAVSLMQPIAMLTSHIAFLQQGGH
jgi:type IV pilus assembly protein PilC